eukprot:scaffold14029_cov121-Isochrysis_galbana.AAC.4
MHAGRIQLRDDARCLLQHAADYARGVTELVVQRLKIGHVGPSRRNAAHLRSAYPLILLLEQHLLLQQLKYVEAQRITQPIRVRQVQRWHARYEIEL